MTNTKIFSMWVGLIAATVLAGCGEDNDNAGDTSLSPSAAEFGGLSLNCDGQQQSSTQQKQVPYQQQQSCVQQSSGSVQQKITFKDSKVADFDVTLACDRNVVIVKSKGIDQKEQTLPIQSDGTVKGTLNFQGQVANDGKGNQQCYIGYVVNFDGKASCNAPSGTQPSPTTSGTPNQGKTLQLTTVVDFEQTNPDALQAAGISIGDQQPGTAGSPTSTPSPTPTNDVTTLPLPSPSVSPSASPSATPTPTTSPSTSPSPSATPSSIPSPSVTPVQICIVDNPCPYEGKGDFSCGQQQ